LQTEGRKKSRERKPKKGGSYIDRRIDFIKKKEATSRYRSQSSQARPATRRLESGLVMRRAVLPYFEKEFPDDDRPRRAVEEGRARARTGAFRMADVRKASLDAHAAARDARDACQDAACFAARAAGHAAATAHVDAHAFGAAGYAIRAILAYDPPKAEDGTKKERDWQYRRLLELTVTPEEQKRGRFTSVSPKYGPYRHRFTEPIYPCRIHRWPVNQK
jgi:hypothetical protein